MALDLCVLCGERPRSSDRRTCRACRPMSSSGEDRIEFTRRVDAYIARARQRIAATVKSDFTAMEIAAMEREYIERDRRLAARGEYEARRAPKRRNFMWPKRRVS
jgi:hypothetical protein